MTPSPPALGSYRLLLWRRGLTMPLSPLLRHGLGAPDNIVDFRHLLDAGTSLLIKLAIPYLDICRLLNCLLTVAMESAALSRADVATIELQIIHHLLIDEFSRFLAQSEESLTGCCRGWWQIPGCS